jgi:hypothetical protein
MRNYLLAALALCGGSLWAGSVHGACKDHSRDPTWVELAVPEGAPRPADVNAFSFISDETTVDMVTRKVGPPHASAAVRPTKLIWCLPDGSEVSVVTRDGTTIMFVRHGGKTLFKRGKKK